MCTFGQYKGFDQLSSRFDTDFPSLPGTGHSRCQSTQVRSRWPGSPPVSRPCSQTLQNCRFCIPDVGFASRRRPVRRGTRHRWNLWQSTRPTCLGCTWAWRRWLWLECQICWTVAKRLRWRWDAQGTLLGTCQTRVQSSQFNKSTIQKQHHNNWVSTNRRYNYYNRFWQTESRLQMPYDVLIFDYRCKYEDWLTSPTHSW